MFYSQDILQKRGGRFSKIWLAATKMSKLSRREISSVDVYRCCNEILAYVEVRVAPAYGQDHRTRFSLYLSALLMYGVVRIHSKLCEYLLLDAKATLNRVKSVPTLIDLQQMPQADLVTNPELLLENVQQERDLYLSQLDMETLRTGHIEPGDFWHMNGSEIIDVSPRKKRKKAKPEEEPVLQVASADEITMKEPPPLLLDTPLSPIPVAKDIELPMLDGQQIDFLMGDQTEEPRLQVSDLQPTSTPFPADADHATRQRLRFQDTSIIESPSRIRQEDREKTPERLPAMEIPETRAVPPSPGVTQIITSPLPRRQIPGKSLELELTPVLPSPTQRKRKRQLAFADAETQIPKTKMRQNMTTGSDTCEKFVLPDAKGKGALDLLAVPGRHELRRKPWLSLWKRRARFRRNIPEDELADFISPPVSPIRDELPGQDQSGLQLEMPAQEVPRIPEPPLSPVLPQPQDERSTSRRNASTMEESVEEMRGTSVSMIGTPAPEISSVEFQRDASTSRVEEPRLAGLDETLVLDDSRRSKKDRTSTRKRKTKSSVIVEEEPQVPPPAFDISVSATSLQTSHLSPSRRRTLYDLVEEQWFDDPYIALPLLQSHTEDRDELLSSITDDITKRCEQYTTFRKICPPQFHDRKSAARMFTALLDLCSQGSVKAKQKRSYEDENIYIRLSE